MINACDEIEHRLTFRCGGCQETIIMVYPGHNLSDVVCEAIEALKRCCGWQFFNGPHRYSLCLDCSKRKS